MTFPAPRWLLAVAVVCHLAPAAPAQFTVPSLGLRGMIPDAPRPAEGYTNKWALVIGTNYTGRNLGPFGELKHAEADAVAFHRLLVEKFGYDKDKAVLLTGARATRDEITKRLREGMLTGDPVTAGDSVLVYFSGHGYRPTADGKAGKVYLLPDDTALTDKKEPDTSRAVDMNYEVAELVKACKARHALVVLDCCHAGALFELPGETVLGRSDRPAGGRGAFADPAFQVIVASRASEQASDGRDGHSPFTAALLRAMEALGRKYEARDRRFQADELYGSLMRFVTDGTLPLNQSPLCRRLHHPASARQGEFHFVLGAGATFPVAELTEEDLKMLIAVVPSTFGNWWADEIPWFMPGLRQEVLPALPPTRSGRREITREQLRQAAVKALETARASTGKDTPAAVRLKLMGKLLDATQGREAWPTVVAEAIDKLTALTRDPATADPTDLHYLAVLYHKQNQVDLARKTYRAADRQYHTRVEQDERLRPVWALCLLDHGWLEYSVPGRTGFQDAADLYRRARTEVFRTKSPPEPFLMFVLCREADAYRKLGRPRLCEDHFKQALDVANRWDPAGTHLLTAAAHKHLAWSYMETWDVPAAVAEFRLARTILEAGDNAQREESVIDRFHVRHGLAMAERFQGRPADALRQYRDLTPDIAAAVRNLDTGGTYGLHHTELRHLLYDRLVNSLERQADCSLFGAGDLAETADDYRRAIRECDFLAPVPRDKKRKDLLYCRAIALSRPTSRVGGAPAPLDARLAAHLFAEAEKVDPDGVPEDKTRVARALARVLIHRAAPDGPADAPPGAKNPDAELCQLLDGMQSRPDRQDLTVLERMMFAYRYLIEAGGCDARSDYHTLGYADDLLNLCRSACRPERPDPHLLAYLRPYFDVAFRAKKTLVPNHAKELIEIAWEATRGVPYDKPHGATAVLVVYFVGDECHLLLDAPGGVSRCFALGEAWSVEDVATAARPGGPGLPLPDDVRRVLKPVRGECTIESRWRDPCRGLGYGEVKAVTTHYGPGPAATAGPTRLQFTGGLKLSLAAHGLGKGVVLVDEADVKDERWLIRQRADPRGVVATNPPSR